MSRIPLKLIIASLFTLIIGMVIGWNLNSPELPNDWKPTASGEMNPTRAQFNQLQAVVNSLAASVARFDQLLASKEGITSVASAKGAASIQIGPSSRGNETLGTARGPANDALPNLTAEQQARIEEVRGRLHNPSYNRSVSFPSLTSELASVPALWRRKVLLEAVEMANNGTLSFEGAN